MRLHAPQGAQSKAREFVLKVSYVMAPYGELVDQVEGALAHRGRGQLDPGSKLLLCCENSAVRSRFCHLALRSE
jgi:hypothetical protein